MNLAIDIAKAFPEFPRPAPSSIARRGENYTTEEARRVQSFFAGRNWQEIDWSLLREYPGDKAACLEFMSNPAFCYYYPAFMVICLQDTNDSTELLHPTISLACRVPRNLDRFDCMRATYSSAQRRLVGAFLLEVDDTYIGLYSGFPSAAGTPKEIYSKHWSDV